MRLTNLQLHNFRNISELDLSTFGNTTIFVGDNAQGKTNVLEAIFLAASGGSFRTTQDQFLVKADEEAAHVFVGTTLDDGMQHIFRIVWQKEVAGFKKIMQVDGNYATRVDLMKKLPAVIFSPEDIDLLRLSPSHRRRFLDLLIGRHDAEYRANIMEYTHIRRQRNQLLLLVKQRRVDEHELDVWDEKLSSVGAQISAKRAQAISDIKKGAADKYALLAEKRGNNRLDIHYAPSISPHTEREYAEAIRKNRPLDIARATTTAGVHRDDTSFILNGQDVRYAASRGEFRSVVLALKLVEAKYLQARLSETPLFLLDDAFSELDESRQHALVEEIKPYQTILTTNDRNLKELFEEAQEYVIEQGRVMVYT